ncbi:MAG: protein kinase [Gammaproteobacteria bacterium]|nr:protein kinase [Gammaproteobacteria bacterium]
MSYTREDSKRKKNHHMNRPSDGFVIDPSLLALWQQKPPALPPPTIQIVNPVTASTQFVLQRLGDPIPLSELEEDKNEIIEVGAFGYVYSGKYQQRSVAIKRMDYHKDKRHHISFEKALELYVKETETLKKLNILGMKNVLKYEGYCFNAHKKLFCLITEYMPRGDLDNLIHDGDIVPDMPDRMRMVCQLTADLAALHSYHLTHYDVKPSNILLGDHWHIKLADYGHVDQHVFNGWGGTPTFMSPEIWHKKSYGSSSDIYGWAVTAWEIAQWQYAPDTSIPDFAAQKSRLLSRLSDDCPSVVYHFIMRGLNLHPASRPTAEKILEGLTIAHPDRLLSLSSQHSKESAMLETQILGFKTHSCVVSRGHLKIETEGEGAKCTLSNKKDRLAIFRIKVSDLTQLEQKPVFKVSHLEPAPELLIHQWLIRHVDSKLIIYSDKSLLAMIIRFECGYSVRDCLDVLISAKAEILSRIPYLKEAHFCKQFTQQLNTTMQDLYAIPGMDEKIIILFRHEKDCFDLLDHGMTLQDITEMDTHDLRDLLHNNAIKRLQSVAVHSVFANHQQENSHVAMEAKKSFQLS